VSQEGHEGKIGQCGDKSSGGDKENLSAAMSSFPTDPRVCFAQISQDPTRRANEKSCCREGITPREREKGKETRAQPGPGGNREKRFPVGQLEASIAPHLAAQHGGKTEKAQGRGKVAKGEDQEQLTGKTLTPSEGALKKSRTEKA